jgi:prepilin-type processing-associated H-X9-DG protein
VSETVADYTGAARLGVAPVVDGSENGWTTTSYAAVTGTTFFGNPAELDEVWMAGFNSTFATTWQFSRGDPSTTWQPGSAAAAGGGSPTQGTGPLDTTTLSRALTTAARIALMGPARASDGPNFTVRSATRRLRSGIADARINDFMGFRLVKPADLVLESFTDGMTVDASGVPGIEPGERLLHDFSDIEPLHMARANGTGGFAPLLFADGHVARVHDAATVGGSTGRGDGYLGNRDARDASGAVTSTAIDAAGYNEVADDLWPKRLRAADASSGGVIR